MNTPTDLETLGRTFLDALVARLGPDGAAGVLMLMAVEARAAGQREPSGREGSLNG